MNYYQTAILCLGAFAYATRARFAGDDIFLVYAGACIAAIFGVCAILSIIWHDRHL
jgi:hypothetical protein